MLPFYVLLFIPFNDEDPSIHRPIGTTSVLGLIASWLSRTRIGMSIFNLSGWPFRYFQYPQSYNVWHSSTILVVPVYI